MTALARLRQLLEGLAAQPPAPPAVTVTPELAQRIRTLIESEMYEYRERTMFWPEGAVTELIAELATRGALEALNVPGPAATEATQPVMLRDPCPRCEGSPTRIPRTAMTDHMRTHHPEEQQP